MSRSKSSRAWLDEHFKDHYVQKAQKDGWRSRAAYKLLQLQEKDKLIKPHMTIVDLGAAPGGWTQVISRVLNGKGQIIALDILPMDHLEDVQFIQGDFTEDKTYQILEQTLNNQKIDLILSDMAPNMSGNKHVDQPRIMYLLELCLDFAQNHLKTGGNFVVKAFQGEGFEDYLKSLKSQFKRVVSRKPDASRSRSSEVYLIGFDKI